MGLTISYTLKLKSATIEEVREKIMALQKIALTFPLVKVNGLVELAGKDCIIEQEGADPHLILKMRALRHGDMKIDENGKFSFHDSTYIIGFDTFPGEGCESATFGLATHGEIQEKNDWTWISFCKTQYASNPKYGGLNNFIRCHSFVIEMLEEIQKLGISCKVNDESGYWENRNLEELISCIQEYNILIATVIGEFKNKFEDLGVISQAPVLDYPNFEYLEAEGNDLLNDKYNQLD